MMNARKYGKLGAIGAGLTIAALALTGCSGGDGGGEGSSTAVMYSSNNETTIGVVTEAAKNHDPAVKVDVVTGSSGPLLERLVAEADSPAADVFYGAPAATLQDFTDVIEPYRSSEADALPEDLLDAEDRWTPTNAHVVAFMANTDQIDDGTAPTTWEDLADPKWRGKIIAADPTQSTTALTAFYGAYKVLGEDKFKDLAANVEITENSSNVYPAVAQGEYAVTIGYESNIYPYIAGGQAGIEMVYPEDGTFVEHDSVILVKGGPDTEAGQALIDTILSKEAQEQNLEQSFRRPVRTDINVSDFVDFENLEDLNVVDIHEDADEQGRDDFIELWQGL